MRSWTNYIRHVDLVHQSSLIGALMFVPSSNKAPHTRCDFRRRSFFQLANSIHVFGCFCRENINVCYYLLLLRIQSNYIRHVDLVHQSSRAMLVTLS